MLCRFTGTNQQIKAAISINCTILMSTPVTYISPTNYVHVINNNHFFYIHVPDSNVLNCSILIANHFYRDILQIKINKKVQRAKIASWMVLSVHFSGNNISFYPLVDVKGGHYTYIFALIIGGSYYTIC